MTNESDIIDLISNITWIVGIGVSITTIVVGYSKIKIEKNRFNLDKKKAALEIRIRHFDTIYEFYRKLLNGAVKATSAPLTNDETSELFIELERVRFYLPSELSRYCWNTIHKFQRQKHLQNLINTGHTEKAPEEQEELNKEIGLIAIARDEEGGGLLSHKFKSVLSIDPAKI